MHKKFLIAVFVTLIMPVVIITSFIGICCTTIKFVFELLELVMDRPREWVMALVRENFNISKGEDYE